MRMLQAYAMTTQIERQGTDASLKLAGAMEAPSVDAAASPYRVALEAKHGSRDASVLCMSPHAASAALTHDPKACQQMSPGAVARTAGDVQANATQNVNGHAAKYIYLLSKLASCRFVTYPEDKRSN